MREKMKAKVGIYGILWGNVEIYFAGDNFAADFSDLIFSS
jgi:hypothetical protein